MADVRELKDQAADYFRKGKFAKAAEAYLALTKAEPKEGQHLIKLGDSYRRDGRKEPAIEAYKRAAEDYAKLGIVIKAIAACKLIIEIDPHHKDAQESLANLCAKRYIRRDQVEEAQPTVRGKKISMDLPDADDLEIETTSQKESTSPKGAARPEPTKPPAKPAKPPEPPRRGAPIEISEEEVAGLELDAPVKPASPARPPTLPPTGRPMIVSKNAPYAPPPRPAEPESIDLIDIDVSEPDAAPAPAPKAIAPPPPPRVIAPPPAPEPTEIELDLGPSAPPAIPQPPERKRGAAYELAADDDEPEELVEELELLPEDAIVAENTAEHEVMRHASAAASVPQTAMATILSDSLLIEGEVDDGEEIELMSITAGGAARPAVIAPPPPPSRPAVPDDLADELDSLIAPVESAPPAPVVDHAAETRAREAAEDAAASQLANEASFDTTGPIATEPAEPDVAPPPPPAIPTGDVEQSHVPLFSELPREAFLDLLETLTFRRVEADDVIVREGDPGKSIFVLASGEAKVVKGHRTPKSLELATLEEGAFFGEMALLNGAPRVASVIATQDSEVLELTEAVLRDLTSKHPVVGDSLKKFYRQRLLSNVMAISPLFRAFDKGDRKMLVEKFKLREMKPNEVIIAEGSRPDGLYVVMHGVAVVTKKSPDGTRQIPLAVLKEGDVFGEMSLLSRAPASANVVAKRRTLVLRLPKAAFDELMFTHPSVLEVVSELTDQRTKVNEQILTGQIETPREALAYV